MKCEKGLTMKAFTRYSANSNKLTLKLTRKKTPYIVHWPFISRNKSTKVADIRLQASMVCDGIKVRKVQAP